MLGRLSSLPWRAAGAALGAHARAFAAVAGALKRFPVPSMGDSISEGTVVGITKGIGEAVGAEEVLVSIETDKVTIDVRSPEAGELKALFAKMGDTVVVGADLFELALGSGGSAGPAPTEAAAPSAPTPPAAAPQTPASARGSAPPLRVHPSGNPSGIRFIGRRGAAPPEPAQSTAASKAGTAPAAPPTKAAAPSAPVAAPGPLAPLWTAEDEANLSRYPRLGLSEAEMRAIDSGGAD